MSEVTITDAHFIANEVKAWTDSLTSPRLESL